jgi:hypothetical protein
MTNEQEVTNLQYQVLEDQVVEVLGPAVIGPHVEARNCRFILSERLQLSYSKFVDCIFECPTFPDSLSSCAFTRCAFVGNLDGCVFGKHNPDDIGVVDACDFSRAHLHGTAFYGFEHEGSLFPKWPMVAIVRPGKNLEALEGPEWPAPMAKWVSQQRESANRGLNGDLDLLIIDLTEIAGGRSDDLANLRRACVRCPSVRVFS